MVRPRKLTPDQLPNQDWCLCGHKQYAHTDTLQKNHGWCIVKGCKCAKFTWSDKKPFQTFTIKEVVVVE